MTDTPFISKASPRIRAHCLYTAFLLFFSLLLFLPLHRSLAQVLTRAINEDGVTIETHTRYTKLNALVLFFLNCFRAKLTVEI